MTKELESARFKQGLGTLSRILWLCSVGRYLFLMGSVLFLIGQSFFLSLQFLVTSMFCFFYTRNYIGWGVLSFKTLEKLEDFRPVSISRREKEELSGDEYEEVRSLFTGGLSADYLNERFSKNSKLIVTDVINAALVYLMSDVKNSVCANNGNPFLVTDQELSVQAQRIAEILTNAPNVGTPEWEAQVIKSVKPFLIEAEGRFLKDDEVLEIISKGYVHKSSKAT